MNLKPAPGFPALAGSNRTGRGVVQNHVLTQVLTAHGEDRRVQVERFEERVLAHDAVGGPAVHGRSSQAQSDFALPLVDVFGRLNGRSQVLGVDGVRDDGVALLREFSNVELQFRRR